MGRGSERTWLVGILKHKIMDHFRRASREAQAPASEGEEFAHEEFFRPAGQWAEHRSEEHTSELQSLAYLVCRLLLEKKKQNKQHHKTHMRYMRVCDTTCYSNDR